jgi:hypothetical protein
VSTISVSSIARQGGKGSGEWILGDVGARGPWGLIPQILTWITAQIP